MSTVYTSGCRVSSAQWGLERIIEVDLDADEQAQFDASVEHVKTLVDQIKL